MTTPLMTPAEEAQALHVVEVERNDMAALLADLKAAFDNLETAFNRLAASSDPIKCVIQGRVEAAMDVLDPAINLIESEQPA